MRNLPLDSIDLYLLEKKEKASEIGDQGEYNKGNEFPEKEYSVDFKSDDKNEIAGNYENPEYEVKKDKKDAEKEKTDEQTDKDENLYSLQFEKEPDENRNKTAETWNSDFDPKDIPVGSSKTEKLPKTPEDEDQFGADANAFEKNQFIQEILKRTK